MARWYLWAFVLRVKVQVHCVRLALVCKISMSMLEVIYISCLWALVCIWLQRLTFLPLSYGTLFTHHPAHAHGHPACQSQRSDLLEKFKPLPLQNETHVSCNVSVWKSFFFFLSTQLCPPHLKHIPSEDKQQSSAHANWNICWCVCSSPKVHAFIWERVGGGGYPGLGMCSCDSVHHCRERTFSTDLSLCWTKRNVQGSSWRVLDVFLQQRRK